MRRELGRRLATLEAWSVARDDDAVDWSMFTDEERAEIRRWCQDCGDRPLLTWARTLSAEERWRVRGVLARIAGQSHAA